MIGDVYSWQFSFEKELTAGTGYVFKPYNTSGAYEGIVTITKKAAATVELDALALSFGSDPALLHTVGSASVELPADSHCSVEWTWTDQFGNELENDARFLCGSYFLSLVVTPDLRLAVPPVETTKVDELRLLGVLKTNARSSPLYRAYHVFLLTDEAE